MSISVWADRRPGTRIEIRARHFTGGANRVLISERTVAEEDSLTVTYPTVDDAISVTEALLILLRALAAGEPDDSAVSRVELLQGVAS